MKKIVSLLLLFPLLVFSQQFTLKKADQKLYNYEYLEAIRLYKLVLEKNKQEDPEIFEKIAMAYYNNASYIEAANWFAKLAESGVKLTPETQFKYGQCLLTTGNELEAKKQFNEYSIRNPNHQRAILFNKQSKSGSAYVFSFVTNVSFNSESSDYRATLKGDTLVFASSDGIVLSKRLNSRNGQYYTSLLQTSKDHDGFYKKPEVFAANLTSAHYQDTPVFTPDGKTLYFTQNNIDTQNNSKSVIDGFNLSQAIFGNGKWTTKGIIAFESNDFLNTARPALSPDRKYLYFSANRKNTNENSDLYRVAILENGGFGKIESLREVINTEGRETYPYITQDNVLFFSSDGHPGYGGLDLFSIDLNVPNASVVNLGTTVNSPFDDFGMIFSKDLTKGFYSSNKPGGKGDDDIYSFEVTKIKLEEENRKFPKPISLELIVRDDKTNSLLKGVSLVVLDVNNQVVSQSLTDDYGEFVFKGINPNTIYTIKSTKVDYQLEETVIRIDSRNASNTILLDKIPVIEGIDLSKVSTVVREDIASELQIDKIYFDVNKYDIRPDAKVLLNRLVAYMDLYKTVKVEIGSHTDSRNSKDYN